MAWREKGFVNFRHLRHLSAIKAFSLFAEVGAKDKTFKIFTREEGGAEHCQGDNLTIGIAYIADWLSDRLKTR
jgi:hypothetical protein